MIYLGKTNIDPVWLAALSLPAFLRELGKRDVRPGGSNAWEWANAMLAPKAGEKILLVSTHWKRGRLPVGLAESGAQVTVMDALAGTTLDAGSFDAVVLEDELSYMAPDQAVKALREAGRIVGPAGRIVLHELLWRQQPSPEVLAAMGPVWGRVPVPMTMSALWETLARAGLTSTDRHFGANGWLRGPQLEADETGKRAASFLLRGAGPGPARARFLAALDHFVRFERFYGWIIIRAVPAPPAP